MEPQIIDHYNELPHSVNVIDKMNEELSEVQKENEKLSEELEKSKEQNELFIKTIKEYQKYSTQMFDIPSPL